MVTIVATIVKAQTVLKLYILVLFKEEEKKYYFNYFSQN